MNTYQHSVHLNVARCNGCTTCLRHCPTEAIRIRDGHAVIDEERCIDCGECIRVCPNKAKSAISNSLDDLKQYRWTIALPAPTLYGQFDHLDDVDYVLDGLLKLGFNEVFEVAAAAEIVSAYTRTYLKNADVKKPAISSACPAILRLIGIRFPSLSDHIIHMLPPMEIAARLARKKAAEQHPELSQKDIGVFFLSPCPAKVSYVNNGFADYESAVSGVIPINDIYFRLLKVMDAADDAAQLSHSGMIGIGWASTGGESTAIFNEKYLAADGINDVIHVLDQIENGNIPPLDFIELNACSGGCVGGVMTIENPFIAKARLQGLRRYLPVSQNFLTEEEKQAVPQEFCFDTFPSYRPISKLSDSFLDSMRMMSEIQDLRRQLPGIDCGACGAPNCRAFAEDITKGGATVDQCPILTYRGKKPKVKKGGDAT